MCFRFEHIGSYLSFLQEAVRRGLGQESNNLILCCGVLVTVSKVVHYMGIIPVRGFVMARCEMGYVGDNGGG